MFGVLLFQTVLLLILGFEACNGNEPSQCIDHPKYPPEDDVIMQLRFAAGIVPETRTSNTSIKSCKCSDPKIIPKPKKKGKIETVPHEFPWLVLIEVMHTLDQVQRCDGSLISDYYVITAAHCVDSRKANHTLVIIGAHDLARANETPSNVVLVEKISVHRDYDKCTARNDIALLRLKEQVTFSSAAWPICLPAKSGDYKGATATVAGWGLKKSGNPSNILLKLEGPIESTERCRLNPEQNLTNVLCGVWTKGKQPCSGDLGGPLMIRRKKRWELIGVVSWITECKSDVGLAGYTRVNRFLKWITKKMVDGIQCTR